MTKKIAIIGGGAAAMMAADILSSKHEVAIYEKGKTIGRKFLVAGNGGFNITNSDTGQALINQYTPTPFLENAIKAFDSQATRQWLSEMDIPTFVGTSGRIFPEKGIKPIHVLNKIRNKLIDQGVEIHLQHEFRSFDNNGQLIMQYKDTAYHLKADYYVFALGGASWSITGSDGTWLEAFQKKGIITRPFQSSNCGMNINWNKHILEYHTGKPLKNISITCQDKKVKGEALITQYGLEGNAVYPLISKLRNIAINDNIAYICIDFKPINTTDQLLQKLLSKQYQPKNYAKVLNLNAAAMAVLKNFTGKEDFVDSREFVKKVKALKIPIESIRPIEEAISTVGGIDLKEVNANFSLRQYPNIFVIGEMLDWDAPTGGYLLQACFSMGFAVGKTLN